MCIAIVRSAAGCDVITLKTNLIFQIKPHLYMAKNSRQKVKLLRNEKRI